MKKGIVLQKLDFRTATSDDVREIINDSGFFSVFTTLDIGTTIIRTREGIGYTYDNEMSYCPIEKATNFQRASLPNNTMFYGVIADNPSDAVAISLTECSSLCRKGFWSIGEEYLSVSYWEVIKPLKIASVITDKTFPCVQDNRLLNILITSFIRKTKEEGLNEKDVEVTKFISSEFSKKVHNSRDYLISATISNDLIEDCGMDAIIYPSVRVKGKYGLNIAISPEATDNKLRFNKVTEVNLHKFLGKAYFNFV